MAQTIDYEAFNLGTLIVKFDLPMRLIDDINKAYDENVEKLPDWNANHYRNEDPVGKIKEEKLVNDILTEEMKGIFLDCFGKYLEIIKKPFWGGHLGNAWINDMEVGEYNAFHFHSSEFTELGLSSVLMLKRPSTYGKEVPLKASQALNGYLEFVGGDQSPLSISQIQLDIQEGEYYVFPYTLVHGVYPFSGTDETRRTLSYNCNLFKDTQIQLMSGADPHTIESKQ